MVIMLVMTKSEKQLISDEKADRLPDAFTGRVETVYDCIVAFREEGAA